MNIKTKNLKLNNVNLINDINELELIELINHCLKCSHREECKPQIPRDIEQIRYCLKESRELKSVDDEK